MFKPKFFKKDDGADAADAAQAQELPGAQVAATMLAEQEPQTEPKKPAKTPLFKWQGILGGLDRRQRTLVFVFLTMLSATLCFTQLALTSFSPWSESEESGYVVLLFAPIAISGMLLGILGGTLEGLIAGAVLWGHAVFQPLDFYEFKVWGTWATPLVFAGTGFFLAFFLTLALRNNPATWRKLLRLFFISFLISLAFSIFVFIFGVGRITVVEITTSLADAGMNVEELEAAMQAAGSATQANMAPAFDILTAAMRLGDPFVQFAMDILVIFFSCAITGFFVRIFRRHYKKPDLRFIFRIWLLGVVTMGFMAVAIFSYVVITEQERGEAARKAQEEIDYIFLQVESQDKRLDLALDLLFEAYPGQQPSADVMNRLTEEYSVSNLVFGYTKESDGTIMLISTNGTVPGEGKVALIEACDDPAVQVPGFVEQILSSNTLRAVARSVANEVTDADGVTHHELVQVIYDDYRIWDGDEETPMTTAELGYLVAEEQGDYIVTVNYPSSMVFAQRKGVVQWMMLAAAVLLALVYVLVERLIGETVVKPVARTNEKLGLITKGKLDTVVDASGSVEFDELSSGINSTVGALKGFIADAERRNEQDLRIAKAIQGGALPTIFPPFPDVSAFDIYANMNPAREVGGDFYDFFLIDDHTLGFLIADVSGKGIPGALFMMRAKAELDNYMATGMDLADAVQTANWRLCEGNEAGMFVTVWAATLDYETGELTYVNAGHNPPLLRHGGKWEWLTTKGGLFLGTFEKAKYKSATLTLERGDELLLYTDGVNEAFSVDEEEYGNERLEAFLAEHTDLHPRYLVNALRGSVASWAEGAEQSDDITMLSLEYGVAPQVGGSLTVPATLDQLDTVFSFIHEELDQRLCPLAVQNKIDIALEELFVNVCRYAYAEEDTPGECLVEYVYMANPSAITISLTDSGVPFDPLTLKDPTKPASIQEAKIGGLGIFMTKKSVDDISYLHDGEHNVIAFRKKW